MKITKIKIGRFAGIRDFEASFGSQLNVIYGPNEIGKSSLMKAIKFALFIIPSINDRDLKSNFGFVLGDFLPKSGGDRIDIELEFELQGTTFKLLKTFGRTAATKRSELSFGVTQLNDHQAVQVELNRVLGMDGDAPKMNVKVWLDVFFSNQASLSRTFEKISNEDEIKNSLAELMSQLEGISIEEFKTRISNRLVSLTQQRWILTDRHGIVVNRPVMSGAQGDFDNPFKREQGLILIAYYAWRNEQKALADRIVLENQYDSIVQDILVQQELIHQGKIFIDANQTFSQSLVQRNIVSANLEIERKNYDSLNEKFNQWTILENAISNFPIEQQRINQELVDLRVEFNTASQVQQVDQIRNTVIRLTELQNTIQQKDEVLNGIIAVSESDLTQASNFSQNLRALQIQLEAQKLNVKLVAKKDFHGVHQVGISEPEQFSLSNGEELTFGVNTQYVYETEEVKLEISAGEQDVTILNKRFEEFSDGLNKLLVKYGVANYEELVQLGRAYTVLLNEQNSLKVQFDNLLEGRDLVALKEQIKQVNAIQVRSIAVLSPLIATKEFELNQLDQTNQRNTKELQNLIEVFTVKTTLLMEIATCNAQVNTLQAQLANFPPRPQEFETDEEFNLHINSMQRQMNNATDELNQLLLSRATLSSIYGTGIPVDDLTESVELFRIQYEKLVAEGHALLKIQQAVDEIEAALGANPFGDLEIKVNDYLARLSNGRYSEVKMEDVAPMGIEKDGFILENHLLSQGTSDILALATRLAMADYYLGDEDGFLMLDDPMTELDDERKVFASQLLSEVAEEKQVFVFTCHGNHKDLLGGHMVEFRL